MDPILMEAVLRALRMVTLITAALVLVDAIGILLSPYEAPPHKPKWAAISWVLIAGTLATATTILLFAGVGLVGDSASSVVKYTVLGSYIGLISGFTCRAISRAERPWMTVFAVIGLTVAGVWFALWDMVG